MVQIIEIMGRSEQGMTRPFICRGDDGNTWFVKGVGSGRFGQVCEWIAGNLALSLGVPIAPFEIVDVPVELVEGNREYDDLGAGPAFGSRRQTIVELNFTTVEQVPEVVQRRVLAFDWWIRNEDRTLSESGGNPNLFWKPDTGELVVIDHNQAFDADFSVDNFLKYHVFSSYANSLFGDAVYRGEFREAFQRALKQWREICDNIPEEWHYLDSDLSVPANIRLDAIFSILNRCHSETLWNQE